MTPLLRCQWRRAAITRRADIYGLRTGRHTQGCRDVERDLVYPLLRGRDVTRWRAESSNFIIAPQDPVRQREGIPEAEMKRKYPKTYSYFKQFEKQLLARRDRKYYPEKSPFYTMRNMAPYVLAPWKVQWKHTGVQNSMRACVTGKDKVGDQKVIFVPFDDFEEAHYFCACVNSSPAFSVIKGYIALDASPHVLNYVNIPRFEKAHQPFKRLSELSQRCHTAAAKGETAEVTGLEAEIDKAVAKLWGITADELKSIQEAQAEAKSGRRGGDHEEDDE